MHLDIASKPGCTDRVQERLVWHKVGCRDHDSLPCAEHHRDDQFASVLPHITRAARKQLGWRVTRVRDVRKQIFGIENDSGLEIIVRKKHRLQLSHDRAGDAYHQLLVWVASDKLRISDVLRTGVADDPSTTSTLR